MMTSSFRGRTVLVLALSSLLNACSMSKPLSLYDWGSYEDQIYASYAEPGKGTPQEQLMSLEKDLEKMRTRNRPVPPGFNAHLGYLYFQTGQVDKAANAFEAEKKQYPESAAYMDRLLARTKAKGGRS